MRILVVGGGLPAYFEASEEEKLSVFQPAFRVMLADWEAAGARVVVLQVGPAVPGRWPWYLLFDVDDLDVPIAMMNRVRTEVGGVRLDHYVQFEVRVGRPFWAREETGPT